MKKKILIILDNIRSAYNVGAIFRTADSLGKVCLIYVCGISPTPENIKVLKTSLGAENSVFWTYFATLDKALNQARGKGYHLYILEQTNKAVKYNKIKFPSKCAIVVGNEIDGVNLIKTRNILSIEIPMYGTKKSLNVEVATAILIYQIYNSWEIT